MAYQPLSSLQSLYKQNSTPVPASMLPAQNSTPVPIGVKATSPYQNTAPKSNTLPAQMQTTNNGSIVDYLNSQGKASDYNTRAQLAQKYGVQNYTGSADQNTQLLNLLKNGSSQQATSNSLSTASPNGTGQPSNAVVQPQYNPPTPAVPPSGVPPVTDISSSGLLMRLANQNVQNNPDYQQQLDAYQRDKAALEQSRINQTQGTADIYNQAIPLEFTQGQATQVQNKYLGQQNALQQALANDLQALGVTQTSQNLSQTALNNAAGYAQPVQNPYGIPLRNPQTGEIIGNGGDVNSGPFMAGQVAGNQALGQQYAQNVSANNQATAIKNQIVSFLNTTPVNPSAFSDLNSALALVSGKISDPRYAQLSAQLNEYLNTLAPILGVGGDTTNLKTQIAQSMINGHMSPRAIYDTLNTIEKTAQTKLQQQRYGGSTSSSSSSNSAPAGWGWNP